MGGAVVSTPDVFTYADQPVRTVVVDGEPWFVAGDVAAVLGYSATEAMTRSMDEDEKGLQILHTPGGDQRMTVISEPGLYDAILRSRVPGAQDFKRWVKHDVLPAIRRTGRYGSDVAMLAGLPSSQLLRLAADAAERAEKAEAEVRTLAAPAAAWNDLAAATGDLTISDAAKILGRAGIATGPRKLYDWLEVNGWIFRRGGRWQVMQTAVNAGVMVERVADYRHPSGERRLADPQPRVTPKGLERLRAALDCAPVVAAVRS